MSLLVDIVTKLKEGAVKVSGSDPGYLVSPENQMVQYWALIAANQGTGTPVTFTDIGALNRSANAVRQLAVNLSAETAYSGQLCPVNRMIHDLEDINGVTAGGVSLLNRLKDAVTTYVDAI